MLAPNDDPKQPGAKTAGRWTALLSPETAVIAVIDLQASLAVRLRSSEAAVVVENAAALVKIATVFGVPLVLSTLRESDHGEPIADVSDAASVVSPIVRATDRRNAWEDPLFRRALQSAEKRKLVLAGLFTEEAVTFTTISMLEAGFEVYVALDACGGTSAEARCVAVRRLEQAGAIPVTTRQIAGEFLDAKSTAQTRAAVRAIGKIHFRGRWLGSLITGLRPEGTSELGYLACRSFAASNCACTDPAGRHRSNGKALIAGTGFRRGDFCCWRLLSV